MSKTGPVTVPDEAPELYAENIKLRQRVTELEESLAARKGLHEGAVLAMMTHVKELEESLAAPLSDEDMEFVEERGFALYKEYIRISDVSATSILKEDGVYYWVAVATKYLLVSRLAGKQEMQNDKG